MYLTAHHVFCLRHKQDGVNVFLYGHGPYVWHGNPPFLPEQNPGTLYAQSVTHNPPGNRIRAYLDVLTPDETPSAQVRQAFSVLKVTYRGQRLPSGVVVGSCWFRFDVEPALHELAAEELEMLSRSAVELLGPSKVG